MYSFLNSMLKLRLRILKGCRYFCHLITRLTNTNSSIVCLGSSVAFQWCCVRFVRYRDQDFFLKSFHTCRNPFSYYLLELFTVNWLPLTLFGVLRIKRTNDCSMSFFNTGSTNAKIWWKESVQKVAKMCLARAGSSCCKTCGKVSEDVSFLQGLLHL